MRQPGKMQCLRVQSPISAATLIGDGSRDEMGFPSPSKSYCRAMAIKMERSEEETAVQQSLNGIVARGGSAG